MAISAKIHAKRCLISSKMWNNNDRTKRFTNFGALYVRKF